MTFVYTKPFRKALALLSTRHPSSVEAALVSFQNNRSDPKLRDHALKGKLKGHRAFSAGWDLRVIYREEGGFITIILVDVGSHNQVY